MSKKDEQNQQTGESGGMNEMQILRKITTKTVLGKSLPEIKKETMLFHVVGLVRGYEEAQSDLGPYIKLKGDFLATRYADGAEFRAPAAIFPGVLSEVIAQKYLQASESEDGKPKQCEFAAKIGAKPADTPTGYEWVTIPIIEMQKNDPLLSMRENVAGMLEQKK